MDDLSKLALIGGIELRVWCSVAEINAHRIPAEPDYAAPMEKVIKFLRALQNPGAAPPYDCYSKPAHVIPIFHMK